MRFHQISRIILAVFFIGAGAYHFISPSVYLPMMPDYLPWQDFCAMDDWDRLAGHVRDPAPLARRAAAAIPEIHRQYSPQAIAHGWLAALRQVATA